MSKHSANVAAAAGGSGNPNVRTRDMSAGGGHGSGPAPATTAGSSSTGYKAGAPYTSRAVNDDRDVRTQGGLTENPYNQNDTNEKGVLGADVIASTSPMIDSPASRSDKMPDRFGNYKATAVASVTEDTPAGQPVSFPADGVLGRG